jgi:hypothetical protein
VRAVRRYTDGAAVMSVRALARPPRIPGRPETPWWRHSRHRRLPAALRHWFETFPKRHAAQMWAERDKLVAGAIVNRALALAGLPGAWLHQVTSRIRKDAAEAEERGR